MVDNDKQGGSFATPSSADSTGENVNRTLATPEPTQTKLPVDFQLHFPRTKQKTRGKSEAPSERTTT